MTQFVIDIDDPPEKWEELYAKLAQAGETGRGLAAAESAELGDVPHPYLWYIAVTHGPS